MWGLLCTDSLVSSAGRVAELASESVHYALSAIIWTASDGHELSRVQRPIVILQHSRYFFANSAIVVPVK